jgi:hypothetical protein
MAEYKIELARYATEEEMTTSGGMEIYLFIKSTDPIGRVETMGYLADVPLNALSPDEFEWLIGKYLPGLEISSVFPLEYIKTPQFGNIRNITPAHIFPSGKYS